ncbi:MAG: hypothetical protein ACRDJE_29160 [Dehalococcoidia bacterium]
MIRFTTLKRFVIPVVAGSALALALLVGVAQMAPAGAAPLDPAGPSTPTNNAWPSKLEIGALTDVWPGSLEIGT